MEIVMLIAFLGALGLAAVLGHTADTRDTEYSMGPVLRTTADSGVSSAPRGNLRMHLSPRSSVERASAF